MSFSSLPLNLTSAGRSEGHNKESPALPSPTGSISRKKHYPLLSCDRPDRAGLPLHSPPTPTHSRHSSTISNSPLDGLSCTLTSPPPSPVMPFPKLHPAAPESDTVRRRHSRAPSFVLPEIPNAIIADSSDSQRRQQPDLLEEDELADNLKESGGPHPKKAAAKLAGGVSMLIGAQFFSKILTFLLNQTLIRFITPSMLGTSVRLELFVSSILFFAREAVRLAAQRVSLADQKPDVYRFEGGFYQGTKSGTAQLVINAGYIPLLLGLPMALFGTYYFQHTGSQSSLGSAAIAVFAASAIVELLSEPSFLLAQLHLSFRTRARAESLAALSRCVVSFLFIVVLAPGNSKYQDSRALLGFALGQLASSLVTSASYTLYGLSLSRNEPYSLFKTLPVWIPASAKNLHRESKVYLDTSTWTLALSIYGQTFFKHLLTEGDRILVSLMMSAGDQGVYALVVNYGSLVARLVFAPVEESLRAFFARPRNSHVSVQSLLSSVLRIYVYLGLLAVVFGPLVSSYLLSAVVTRSWARSTAPKVLATYTCYIPFLALNGVLEAFVQSSASPQQIKAQGFALLVISGLFAIAAYTLVVPIGLGAQGLVFANMVNMALRIAYCAHFVCDHYQKLLRSRYTWLLSALPPRRTFVATLGIAVAAHYVGPVRSMTQLFQHGILASILLTAILLQERNKILQAVHLIKPKSSFHDKGSKRTADS